MSNDPHTESNRTSNAVNHPTDDDAVANSQGTVASSNGNGSATSDRTGTGTDADYNYQAFISYRHTIPDSKLARWLHQSLETYRVPDRLCKSRGLPKRLKHCFLDREELGASSGLTHELEKALRDSQYLIVVCSPRTPESPWVRKEISRFREWGRDEQILALLIEDEPIKSFPPELYQIRPGIGDDEPLAADVRPTREDSLRQRRQQGLLRLIAKILNIQYDELRNREQERQIRNARKNYAIAVAVAIIVAIVGTIGVGMRNAKIEALQTADAARIKADAAEAERVRSTLEDYHAQTDAHLAQLRLLRNGADRPDAQQEILRTFEKIGALRQQADRITAELGERDQLLAVEERRWWKQQVGVLRNEATQELTRVALQRGRSVPLPDGPTPGIRPTIALRDDLTRFAVAYPGAGTVLVLDADGRQQHQLNIPKDIASKMLTPYTKKTGGLFETRVQSGTATTPFRLDFIDNDHILLHFDHDLLTWTLPDAEPRHEPQADRPSLKNPWNVNNNRYLATVGNDGSVVSVRDWTPDAQARIVWQAKEKDGENSKSLAFGIDDRSLFIITAHYLSLVDAATRANAEVRLAVKESSDQFGELLPCKGGVAIVERRTVDGRQQPPRLVVWNATLPQIDMRLLHHDDPPKCLDWANDGLLVSGGADHLVRAWRGQRQHWIAGVPYIEQKAQADLSNLRIPSIEVPAADLNSSVGYSSDLRGEQIDWRRMMWSPNGIKEHKEHQVYKRPLAYLQWEFLSDPAKSLLVQRRELLPGGQNRKRVELYSAEDGRLVHAFASEGNGSLLFGDWGISPDRRFALVVNDDHKTPAAVEVWSLADQKVLGRIGRSRAAADTPENSALYPMPAFLSSGGEDWLLASYEQPIGTGWEMEIWRLPQVQLIGKVPLANHPHGPLGVRMSQVAGRAWIYGGVRQIPPKFATLVDLDQAERVCDLEGIERTPEGSGGIVTGAVNVMPWHDLLSADPYHISAWDLTNGKRTELDKKPWTNQTAPQVTLSPTGDRIVICGNLHENSMLHVELWDLTALKLVREFTYPTNGKPYVTEIHDSFFTVELNDYPDEGQSRKLNCKWTNGELLLELPANDAKMVAFNRMPGGTWNWLLWESAAGFSLQKGVNPQRVLLQNSSKFRSGVPELSPDSRFVSLPGAGGGLWDADKGQQIATFTPSDQTRGFDPTSHWALTVSETDGEVSVWDTSSGKVAFHCQPKQSSDPPFDPLQDTLKLSASGNRVAVLTKGVLRLWDVEHNRQILTFDKPGHFTQVNCVAQHVGAGLAASAGDEGVVMLWNRDDGRLVRTLFTPFTSILSLRFNPAGTRLAVAAERTVSLFDLQGHEIWSSPISEAATSLTQMSFHPNGTSLLIGTQDGRLLTLDPETGDCLSNKLVDDTGIQSLAWSPEGSLLAIGSSSRFVHLWDVARNELRHKWDTGSPVGAVTFVGGNDLLAIGGRAIQFFDADRTEPVWTLDVSQGPVRMLLLDEATGELAVSDSSEKVVVFNLPQLFDSLDQLKLAIAGFPRGKWPLPEKKSVSHPPSLQNWQRLTEEFHANREGTQENWARAKAKSLKPADWHNWYDTGKYFLRSWQAPKVPKERALAASQWQLAVDAFSKALDFNDADWQIWKSRAEAYFYLRQWTRVIDDCAQGIERDSQHPELWYLRGLAHHKQLKYDLAIADFDRALELDPDHAAATAWRGDSFRWLGENDRAISDLSKFIERKPSAALALAVRGAAFRAKRRLVEALADINEAIRLQPDLAFAYTQRAELYRLQKRDDLALEDLDAAIALDPYYSNPHNSRGILYQSRGELAQAVIEFSDAIRLAPESSLPYRLRGEAQTIRGDYNRALADHDRAVQLDPNNAVTYFSRGYTRHLIGDRRRAIADYVEAIRLAPKVAGYYNQRGVAYKDDGQLENALADFDQAKQLDPQLLFPYFNRGEVYNLRREFSRAIDEYSQAIARDSKHIGSWIGRGNAHAELGRWDEATSNYARVRELVPGNPVMQYRLAMTMLGGGDEDKYRAEAAKLLDTYRTVPNPDLNSMIAWANVMLPGNEEKAQVSSEVVAKACAHNPKSYVFAHTLGAAMYRAGKHAEAEKQLTEAGKLLPPDGGPIDWLLRAMNYAKLGQAEVSKAWFDKAVAEMDQPSEGDPQKPNPRGLNSNWLTRLQLQSLRHEAKKLLETLTP